VKIVIIGEDGFAYRSRESFPEGRLDHRLYDVVADHDGQARRRSARFWACLGAPLRGHQSAADHGRQRNAIHSRRSAPHCRAVRPPLGHGWKRCVQRTTEGSPFSLRLRFSSGRCKRVKRPRQRPTRSSSPAPSRSHRKRATLPDTFDLVGLETHERRRATRRGKRRWARPGRSFIRTRNPSHRRSRQNTRREKCVRWPSGTSGASNTSRADSSRKKLIVPVMGKPAQRGWKTPGSVEKSSFHPVQKRPRGSCRSHAPPPRQLAIKSDPSRTVGDAQRARVAGQ